MAMYRELMDEVQKLQIHAEEARRAEKAEVLGKIRALILEHELLPSDFGFERAEKRKSVAVPAKYRDAETGAT